MTVDQDVHFRHSGWLRDRRRVWDALNVVFPGSTRARRFTSCGSNAWVVRDEENPARYAIVSDHCRDRFCRPCASFRGRVIAHNVVEYIRHRPYRFVTITIKTTGLTLKEGVDKLYRCFGKLRRTKLWALKVKGGCAVCEVLPRAGGTEWHPHLHLITEGKYLPVKPLRKLWMQITGDSYIVDVQMGKDADAAASYVSKYITKPFDDGTTRNPAKLIEAIRALHGRRLVSTFGSWRGYRLTEYHPAGVWIKVKPLGVLRLAAERGDPDARELYDFLTAQGYRRNLPRPDTPTPWTETDGSPPGTFTVPTRHRSGRDSQGTDRRDAVVAGGLLRNGTPATIGSHHPPLQTGCFRGYPSPVARPGIAGAAGSKFAPRPPAGGMPHPAPMASRPGHGSQILERVGGDSRSREWFSSWGGGGGTGEAVTPDFPMPTDPPSRRPATGSARRPENKTLCAP